jgi:sterol desaturase/sphingolipid hydroxylase (fatty acid hydroxylase superfamily)
MHLTLFFSLITKFNPGFMEILFRYHVYWLFLILIAIEALLVWQSGRKYSVSESVASFWINIGQIVINQGIVKSWHLGILTWIWQHRLLTIPLNSGWSFLGLFIGLEFCYYWQHRYSHRVRWAWATHAVHHSVKYFNLSASYRIGWTGWLSGNILFFLPLCWLGFPPIAVVAGLALNLIYQFWIHTELIPKLGILELIFNTPANHRVHHASNSQYIDKNYGGVLIVFDRLFGTYQSEQEAPIYGLTKPIDSHNPWVIASHEWTRLYQDLCHTRNWQQFFHCAFYSPDWFEKSVKSSESRNH